jgi:integrase
LRFHGLRHAHATPPAAERRLPEGSSERLGHSKIGIIFDRYSHVLPNTQEDAVAKVDAAMQAAINKRETKG